MILIHIGANDMNGGQGLYKKNDKPSNHDFIKTDYLNKYDKGYFIECIPSTFKILQKNLKYINKKFSKNYIAINELVDIETDKIKEFNIISEKEGIVSNAASSIFKPNYIFKKNKNLYLKEILKIKSITFNDLIKKYNINIKKNFNLVLDTQGNELRVLKGMGEYLKNVNILETEFTNDEIIYYDGGCKFSELDKFLTDNNFILMYKQKKKHGNAIYHNKNMKL